MRKTGRNIFRTVTLGAIIACAFTPLFAQVAEKRATYEIVESVSPPKSDTGSQFRAIAEKNKNRLDVTYAREIKGQLISGEKAEKQAEYNGPELSFNNSGVFLALLLILGLLLGWLKFGGGGVLLARPPRDDMPTQTSAPEGWGISGQEIDDGTQDLLARLATMQDRGAALVLLLRHCLLAVGTATRTRFARSDTERNAFARLPGNHPQWQNLSYILRAAELAHYGGRNVSEGDFAVALDAGRSILGHDRGRAHG